MDNACLKFELMGCEEPKTEPLLGFDYGYSPCVGKCPTACCAYTCIYSVQRKSRRFSIAVAPTVRNGASAQMVWVKRVSGLGKMASIATQQNLMLMNALNLMII